MALKLHRGGMMADQSHNRTVHDDVQMGTERGFGMVFAAVFTIIALWPVTRGADFRWPAFAVAIAFLLAALWRPEILRPLNRIWFKFGHLLSRITTPIVMGALFLLVVVPTGIVMRALGARSILGDARVPSMQKRFNLRVKYRE